MARKKTEDQVKKHLTKIRQIDGGWEAMLNILWRRRIIAMLKEARIAQGLTQAQVAERMGVTQGRVAEIENDPWPDPYVSTLAAYAHALGGEILIEAVPKPDLTEPDDLSEYSEEYLAQDHDDLPLDERIRNGA